MTNKPLTTCCNACGVETPMLTSVMRDGEIAQVCGDCLDDTTTEDGEER